VQNRRILRGADEAQGAQLPFDLSTLPLDAAYEGLRASAQPAAIAWKAIREIDHRRLAPGAVVGLEGFLSDEKVVELEDVKPAAPH
jgi:hypothetical protein